MFWVNVDQLTKDNLSSIIIDTRGFNFMKLGKIQDDYSKIINESPERFLRSADYVINWILHLKEVTGGDRPWRLLSMDLDGCRLWKLKYICIVETDKGYLLTNSDGDALEWDLLTDDKIVLEDLFG